MFIILEVGLFFQCILYACAAGTKWQIQRQFTLVRQLLEVDFQRVLRV